MRANKNLLVFSIALLSLGGCSTFMDQFSKRGEDAVDVVAIEPPVEQVRVESKQERTGRENTLAWDNIGRAGAAIHQPDYVHVLGGDELISYESGSTPAGTNIKGALNALQTLKDNGVKSSTHSKGYSMYELSRWERYCNAGKGMDEHDWRFVSKEGYDNAPLEALGGACLRPTYRYPDYMAAWERFCTSSAELNRKDRQIVGETSRPFSKVNPCKALMK